MYIVGIDIGQRHPEANIIDGQGNLHGKSLRLDNTHTSFNKLLESDASLKPLSPRRIFMPCVSCAAIASGSWILFQT